MDAHLDGDVVRVDGNARQRFYDSRGYGRPLEGNEIALAPVEAAHLLSRGDLEAVVADDTRLDFREFLTATDAVLEFVVYKDLRDRGFYLSPAREGWVADPADADLVVYPRGKGPWDDEVAHRVRVVGERAPIRASDLGEAVLAVVDEDGELTYFETEYTEPDGSASYDPPADLDATLLADRALLWEPPTDIYSEGFYGQRLYGRNADAGPIQLSLVEASYLVHQGTLSLSPSSVVERGQAVEGERFDRRRRVYAALRDAGAVPKSGFKFGADFRVYDGFSTVDDLGHSDRLVRVAAPGHVFLPRDLSLDVRLAGGVRKRMVFALTGANGEIDWLSVARLTP
jgi:tRNA-intron endonuclease